MRIPDDLLTAPIFLGGRDRDGNFHYRATAFLVGAPSKRYPDRLGWPCLVTARHNVLKAQATYGNLWVRVNTDNGSAVDVEVTRSWLMPENPASDIALIPFAWMGDWEPFPFPVRWFVTDESIEQRGIGIGDDLIVLGLFSNHVGVTRNLPIVRTGSIASMPQEPLSDPNTGDQYDAYLAEVRSIGGLSGSPVFVALNPVSSLDVKNWERRAHGQPFYLLGLIRGHWDTDAEADFGESEFGRLNTGIAIVTPITDVFELLEDNEIVEYSAEMDARWEALEGQQVEDFASESNEEFDRFSSLAGKLLRVPRNEVDEKRRQA